VTVLIPGPDVAQPRHILKHGTRAGTRFRTNSSTLEYDSLLDKFYNVQLCSKNIFE